MCICRVLKFSNKKARSSCDGRALMQPVANQLAVGAVVLALCFLRAILRLSRFSSLVSLARSALVTLPSDFAAAMSLFSLVSRFSRLADSLLVSAPEAWPASMRFSWLAARLSITGVLVLAGGVAVWAETAAPITPANNAATRDFGFIGCPFEGSEGVCSRSVC